MVATSVFYVQCVRKAVCNKQTVSEHVQLLLEEQWPTTSLVFRLIGEKNLYAGSSVVGRCAHVCGKDSYI